MSLIKIASRRPMTKKEKKRMLEYYNANNVKIPLIQAGAGATGALIASALTGGYGKEMILPYGAAAGLGAVIGTSIYKHRLKHGNPKINTKNKYHISNVLQKRKDKHDNSIVWWKK